MDTSKGSYSRRFQGNSGRNLRAEPSGEECRDWLKDYLSEREAGEIAKAAGCTKRAAENIRAGDNSMRMEFLVAMCRNDAAFRAQFFEFCGGKLQFPPEITAALAKVASWQENENAVRGVE